MLLALKLPKAIEARLARLAKQTGRTKSFYAREAIVEHIADLEDTYLAGAPVSDNPEFVDYDDATSDSGIDPDRPGPKP